MDSGTESIALRLIVCLKAYKSPEFVELFFSRLHNCVLFDTASNYFVKANLFFPLSSIVFTIQWAKYDNELYGALESWIILSLSTALNEEQKHIYRKTF